VDEGRFLQTVPGVIKALRIIVDSIRGHIKVDGAIRDGNIDQRGGKIGEVAFTLVFPCVTWVNVHFSFIFEDAI
jgi:hypothetical protein